MSPSVESLVTDGDYIHFYVMKYGADMLMHDAAHHSHVLLPIVTERPA